MMAEALLTLVVVTLIASMIAITVNTADRISRLKDKIKKLERSIAENSRLIKSHSRNSSEFRKNRERTFNSYPGRLSGDLDIYHEGKMATVKAVFRTKA